MLQDYFVLQLAHHGVTRFFQQDGTKMKPIFKIVIINKEYEKMWHKFVDKCCEISCPASKDA